MYLSKQILVISTCIAILWLLLLLVPLDLNAQNKKADQQAVQIVQEAADAIGGLDNLRLMRAVKTEGKSYQNHLMDSEHPNGPFSPDYENFIEIQDIANRNFRRDSSTVSLAINDNVKVTIETPERAAMSWTIKGQTASVFATPPEPEWFIRNPAGAVFAALEANNLSIEKDEITQGVPHRVVAFTWRKIPVRLFINKYNHLPTAVETVRAYPYDILRGMWGDFVQRVVFSQWDLKPGGVHYPQQWDIYWNGELYKSQTLSKVEINPQIAADAFSIPDKVKSFGSPKMDDLPLGSPQRPPVEIAPNVIQIPGSWYTTLVRQKDGVVIVEAPISNGYSAKVIAEAEKRFPGAPVKAVITSTSYWWHFAGLREYAARGIPIYALDLNQPLITKLLNSPHLIEPDSLAKHPRRPKLNIVSGKTVIGEDDNQLEVYPIRAAATQMLMVYFPKHRLLYSAEMAQPFGPNNSFIFPHDLSKLLQAIKNEKLKVETLIGMHLGPTPLSRAVEDVNKVSTVTEKTDVHKS